MRKFIQIVSESVTNDVALNHQIEAKLAEVPVAEDRTKVLDGLQVIFDAGAAGVSIAQWVEAMRGVWPAQKDEHKRIFKLMQHVFGEFVKRDGNGNYTFATAAAGFTNTVDMSSPIAQMAKQTIELTATGNEMMRAAGTFTASDIAAQLAAQAGLSPEQALATVDHLITSSAGTIKPLGGGTYRYEEPAKKTGLSFLKDLEGYEPAKQYDVKLHNDGGSLVGIEPLTDEARMWIEEYVHVEDYQRMGNISYVEMRYAPDIVNGMEEDGLSVEKLTRQR